MKGVIADAFELTQMRIKAGFDTFFRTNEDMHYSEGGEHGAEENPLEDFGGPSGKLKAVRESFELVDENDKAQVSVPCLKG
jgi:hypothetical protein